MAVKSKVYKIGMDLYKSGDKNSGLYEKTIVETAASKANITDTLIIINGKFTSTDAKLLPIAMKDYKHKVFVCSDAIAFKNNLDIINSLFERR